MMDVPYTSLAGIEQGAVDDDGAADASFTL